MPFSHLTFCGILSVGMLVPALQATLKKIHKLCVAVDSTASVFRINLVRHNMQELLTILASKFPSEWVVSSYDGCSLTLSSGTSVEYATPTVVFSGVSYLSCPFMFSWPVFRTSTSQEREQFQAILPLEAEDVLVIIEAETMAGLERKNFSLVVQGAESVAAREPKQ